MTPGLQRLRLSTIGPGSRVGRIAYRTLMAAAVPRFATRRDRASRAVARALSTTALGRLPEEETEWTQRIEARRRELMSDQALVAPDIPSESGGAEQPPFAVSTASLWISLPPLLCLFLMRLVRELAPRSCLELGTGFGISGAYQAASLDLNGTGRLETFERAAGLAGIAEEGFSALALGERVGLRVGPIEEMLEEAAERISPVDYAFVDADHTAQATIEHFEIMLPHLADGAVVVLDDINWPTMTEAWKRIRRHRRASLALGLRRLGVVVVSGPAGHPRPAVRD